MGYRVLRFWNASVLTETSRVMETIFSALYFGRDAGSTSPTLTLPLRGRELTNRIS